MAGPLIPIKNADGTIEKITLDEFKIRKKNLTTTSSSKTSNLTPPPTPTPTITSSSSTITESDPITAISIPAPKNLLTSSPKKIIKPSDKNKIISFPVDDPIFKASKKVSPEKLTPLSTEDAKSLLEEELPKAKKVSPSIKDENFLEAEKIIKELNLNLSQDIQKRLIGLIQLYFKDIRSKEEVLEWLIKSKDELGIGLDKVTAQKILIATENFLQEKIKNTDFSEVTPLKIPLGTPTSSVKKLEELDSSTSFIEKNTKTNSNELIDRLIIDEIKQVPAENISDLLLNKNNQATANRPIVQDIVSAKTTHLGPVDEIKYFTLVDFRRLSANPEEAAARLYQKFLNLKEESYLMYLEALEAWRKSPLFIEYSNTAILSINRKMKLENTLTDKSINLAEIKSLVKLQKLLA